jgi:hypothetical protein
MFSISPVISPKSLLTWRYIQRYFNLVKCFDDVVIPMGLSGGGVGRLGGPEGSAL